MMEAIFISSMKYHS